MRWEKGARFPSEYSCGSDRVTGARIHQITAHPSINHATYFLQSSFYPDGEALIFISNRGGSWQLFELSVFPGGEIRQLTDAEAIHPFSPAIHPDGQGIFFVRGGAIWRLDRATLRETLVIEFPGAQLGEPSLDPQGQWIAAAARRGAANGIVRGRADGTGWDFLPFPRTVIHPQFHPLEPEWIEFAGDPAPRMHRIRRDGAGLECLYEHGNDEFVVHETFLGLTGDIVYTVWPFALRRLEWTAGNHSTIAECNAWHITPSRSGSHVVCDTNHPDEGIFLIDASTGQRRLVCLSEASNRGSQWKTSRYALADDFAAARSAAGSGALSWMEVATDTVYGPQWTHPHPSFSPCESRVVFTSDKTGHPQVYAAELEPPPSGSGPLNPASSGAVR